MNIAEVFQNKTCQNHTNISRDLFKQNTSKLYQKQEMNRIHLSSLTSHKGYLLASAKHKSSFPNTQIHAVNRQWKNEDCTIRNRLVKGTAKVYSPPAQGTCIT